MKETLKLVSRAVGLLTMWQAKGHITRGGALEVKRLLDEALKRLGGLLIEK